MKILKAWDGMLIKIVGDKVEQMNNQRPTIEDATEFRFNEKTLIRQLESQDNLGMWGVFIIETRGHDITYKCDGLSYVTKELAWAAAEKAVKETKNG